MSEQDEPIGWVTCPFCARDHRNIALESMRKEREQLAKGAATTLSTLSEQNEHLKARVRELEAESVLMNHEREELRKLKEGK